MIVDSSNKRMRISGKNLLVLSLVSGVLLASVPRILCKADHGKKSRTNSYLSLDLKPWESIGGCGAGGSGGSSGDGIKWVGMGVSGGLIDIEVVPKYSIGRTFRNFSVAPRFSFKPTYTITTGVSIPLMSKSGQVQYLTIQDEKYPINGVLGDISCDVSKTFGFNGDFSASLGLTFPTGQYDTKRGSDRDAKFLPSSLQMGAGLFNLSLGLGKTFDFENGILLIDLSYSNPFAARPFINENEFLDSYFSDYKDLTNNRRFYYRGKPYGENDLGAFTPPSISGGVFYGYRGVEHQVHSWGVNVGIPLAVAWINSENSTTYDPKPDPDHKTWSTTLVYGVEFSRQKFPLYMAVSLPIHDKANTPGENPYDESPMKTWDGPDWEDFLQQWHFAIGFKTTMF